MGRWRSYRKLDRADRQLLLVMSLALPIIAVSVRFAGFRRVFSGIGKIAKPRRADSVVADKDFILRVRKLTRFLKRKGVYRGNCLSRSLTMWMLLRRQGICCDLIVGSRLRNGEFQAHAWVEQDGQPLNANKLVRQRYTVFECDLVPDGSMRSLTN